MKKKWMTLAAMMLGGSTLLANGCLGEFWGGLMNQGWPKGNPWINIGLDILHEELFG